MDITWLPSRVGGRFFYLYMVEDLFSRYGVHWKVFESECSEHTNTVIEQAMWREGCVLNPPRLHNDNAYIESLFRTLKYSPMWPSQGFENIEQAREWVKAFIDWYNFEHRHSAIRFVTPSATVVKISPSCKSDRHSTSNNAVKTHNVGKIKLATGATQRR